MKLPDDNLMKKIYWVDRYFKRVDKLFDLAHEKWLNEAIKNYGSKHHQSLTQLKNRICLKKKILIRYSSILTSKALVQMSK